MSERLSVAVRVRPFLPHESLASCVAVQANQITIGETKGFAFDRVFDMNATSDDVYVALGQPLADAFLSGFHASTIAYGQTGAGKTFTMDTLLSDTVQEIFCRLEEEEVGSEDAERRRGSTSELSSSDALGGGGAPSASPGKSFSMSLTVLEVYNEAIGDLLSKQGGLPFASTVNGSGSGGSGGGNQQRGGAFASEKRGSGPSQRNGLQLREDPSGGVYVVGLTEVSVDSEARLLALIDDAIGNRKTASTLMNATSSRSHCVVTLTLRRRGMCSRCCFVDLAGSERLKKSLGLGAAAAAAAGGDRMTSINPSDAAGSPSDVALRPANAAVRMREGININGGLLALGNVIVALCERRPHVPYRSSKLTRLLQPMLEGNSRTAMIACVAPLASSLEETLNTLKYADRAKRIQLNPHLAIAPTHTAADTHQLIAALREQLEEAQRRLNAVASRQQHQQPQEHSGAAPSDDAVELRVLLTREREVTKRLEGDLFNAEYTAMVEVERRKALEARVAELEARLRASRDGPHVRHSSTEMVGAAAAAARDEEGDVLMATPPSPRARLTMNMARLQRLEEERESLAALRDRRVRDTAQLEATLADDAAHSAEAPTAAAALTSDAATVDQLTGEIQQKESQIAQLQRENDEVSAQLLHYERELQGTLTEKAQLQEELRRAEAQLERSAMVRDEKEAEKAALRATYLERIRKAEVRATEYRRRVREAEQEVRTRQDNIDRSRQLQDTVLQLREELTRQRLEVRTAKKQSDQRSAVHQQEVLQLQRQLQLAAAQVAQLQQRMARKDAAIAKTRRQLTEQQQQQQQQSAEQMAPPAPLLPAAAVTASHTVPPTRRSSSRRVSVKQPPAVSASPPNTSLSVDTPPSGTSPPRITKRRVALTSRSRSPRPHDADPSRETPTITAGASQALINRELQELERLERELAELREYREVLLSAQSTDAPKWHRAREGFTRRLAVLESALATMESGTPAHANLQQEEQEVRSKLQQLQTYRHMFEDADEQLAEFENRIENLHTARRFHLQRVRRLQQASARRRRESDGGGNSSGRLSRGGGGLAASTERANAADGEVSLPSVRDIRTTRLACSVSSLSDESSTCDTPPPLSPLKAAAKHHRRASTYTAPLGQRVTQQVGETISPQSQQKTP